MACLLCGAEIKPWKKYCNKSCQRSFEAEKVDTVCIRCGRVTKICRMQLTKKRHTGICRSCVTSEQNLLRYKNPEDHPSWAGGFKYHLTGRFGRDPQGLSWKTQKLLALQRDTNTCQTCGKYKLGWKPDVHHIKPYRLCYSHHVDNLVCLCRSCHKKADAKIKELWGGETLQPPQRPPAKACNSCGHKHRKLNSLGLCVYCHIQQGVEKAKLLLSQGCSHSETARLTQMNRTGLYKWLKVKILPKCK